MGQLERYGLYVLCLVIVLILGVAIWGGSPPVMASAPDAHGLLAAAGVGDEGELEPVTPPGAATSSQDYGTVGPGPAMQAASNEEQSSSQMSFFERPADDQDELNGLALVDDAELAPSGEAEAKKTEPAPVEPPPTTSAIRTYTIQSGDTFEGIALSVLGSRKYMTAIQDLNPDVNPKRMKVGAVIKLPSVSTASSKTDESTGDGWRKYTVKKGDSVYNISFEMYGNYGHMKEILSANGISQPKSLQPGTELRIPPAR